MRAPLRLALLPSLLLLGCAAEESQSAQDRSVVYGVLDSLIFLYDQNIVGTPVGHQDVTADCAMGGTAHIVGETAEDVNAVIDLTVTLTGCGTFGQGYDLTMDGELVWAGSFRPTGYKALGTTSDLLHVVGDVDVEPSEVDASCALTVTDRGEDGQASVVSGEWCERTVEF